MKQKHYIDIFEKWKVKYDQAHNNVSMRILTVRQVLGFAA